MSLEDRVTSQGCAQPKCHVLIFGGARGMGLWIGQFLARRGHAITIVDPYEKTAEIAHASGFQYARVDHTNLASLLVPPGHFSADVIVVAVPISLVEATARAIGPFVKPSGLLMDVTSLKAPAIRAMEDSVAPTVAVLGTHPMFAPRVPSFFAQTCVVVDGVRRPPGGWSQWWADSVEAEGGIVVRATALEHDEIMLDVQVLLHYAIMAFASTLAETHANITRLYQFRSPLWEVAVGLVARMFTGNPDLYFSIQQHPDAPRLRSRLLNCAEQLAALLADVDPTDFRQFAGRIHDHFGQSNLSAYSDTIASLFSLLASHKADLIAAKGQRRCVRNIDSKAVHYGLIAQVTAEHLELVENKRRVTIALKKARLLPPAEETAWKAAHLPVRRVALALLVPAEAQETAYAALVRDLPGVTTVQVIDVYSGPPVPGGHKKVTFGVGVINDELVSDTVIRIRKLATDLGCDWKPRRPGLQTRTD